MNSSVRLPNHDTRAKLEKVLAITSKDIHYFIYIIQLLDETEQNIVIYQWRANQLFVDAEGRGK